MDIEQEQTSGGFAVLFHSDDGEREQLIEWAERKGSEGVAKYWAAKNQQSIDGLPTGLLER